MRLIDKILLLSLFALSFLMKVSAAPIPRLSLAVDHAPPYSQISEEGDITGAIVDIAEAIQARVPFKIELVACPFPRCLKMLEDGEVNAMGGLIRTVERQTQMHFLMPPYMILSSSFVFYGRHDSELAVQNYGDLYGKKVAVMRGAAHFKRFDQDKKLEKIEALSEKNAIDMLLKGRVDLVVAVEETAEHSMSVLNQPINKLKKMSYRYDDVIYGYFVLSRQFKNTPLAIEIEHHMKLLAQSGELTDLVAPYNLPPIEQPTLGFY
ncbi:MULTISPECIES: substrate-binding periplasmic protein [Pseudoalteromonas]|uniref:substrate-binding periplasmic protein n=1 Tax=Pseudoalteromonas TaxID=53246 RepID=UPI000A89534D|nr:MULTISPECIES: transporter substrate-binding domain-containing protein [Pseudoalteromonas]